MLCVVCALIIGLIPIKINVKDGGTRHYCALLYRITVWHVMESTNEGETTYFNKTQFYIFPFNFFI